MHGQVNEREQVNIAVSVGCIRLVFYAQSDIHYFVFGFIVNGIGPYPIFHIHASISVHHFELLRGIPRLFYLTSVVFY